MQMFQPVEFDGKFLIDGGAVYNANVASGIHQCLNLVGGDESKVTVDVYTATHSHKEPIEKEGRTIKDTAMRDLNIRFKHKFDEYMNSTMKTYPDVNFRYVIGTDDFQFDCDNLLNFDTEITDNFF